jgi:hypothetical protein
VAPVLGGVQPCGRVRTSAVATAGIAAANSDVGDLPIVLVVAGEIGVAIGNAVGAGHEARDAASARAAGPADMADPGLGSAAGDAASTIRVGAAGVISGGAAVLRRPRARAATVSLMATL